MKIKTKIVLFTCILCILSIFLVSLVNYNFTAKELLEKQGETNEGNVYYLGFPDGSTIFGIDYIPPDDFDCTERNWYIDAQTTDDVVVSSPYIDFRTGDITVTLSKAIKKGDELVGVLGSDIFVDHLVEIVSNLELGKDSYGFLMDGEGNIITHENEEFTPDSEKGYVNADEILNGELKDIVHNDKKTVTKKQLKDYDGKERLFFIEDIKISKIRDGGKISERRNIHKAGPPLKSY